MITKQHISPHLIKVITNNFLGLRDFVNQVCITRYQIPEQTNLKPLRVHASQIIHYFDVIVISLRGGFKEVDIIKEGDARIYNKDESKKIVEDLFNELTKIKEDSWSQVDIYSKITLSAETEEKLIIDGDTRLFLSLMNTYIELHIKLILQRLIFVQKEKYIPQQWIDKI